MEGFIIFAIIAAVFVMGTFTIMLSRYKKCPADRIMVIYGKTQGSKASICKHGGAAFIWPVVQDYGFLSLRPIEISSTLDRVRCKENGRIDLSLKIAVGIGTEPNLMTNAANRLFGLHPDAIFEQGLGIIQGNLKKTVMTFDLDSMDQYPDLFAEKAKEQIEEGLNQLGLTILNIDIDYSSSAADR